MITRKLLDRISDALDWYEGTDGSEREDAAKEMYEILSEIYEDYQPGKR